MATWSGKQAVEYLGDQALLAIDAELRLTQLFRVVLARGPRQDLHVRVAAGIAAMEVRSFERWMRRWAGVTWVQFVDRWRVDEAKKRLSRPGVRVKEVADALGYRRSDVMARAFRKRKLALPHTFIQRGPSPSPDVASRG